MNSTSKERTKKYRENKKLRELNQQIKEKDILRGEKLTSKREEVILRENLKLNWNETKARYKVYISKLIRYHYSNSQDCYFFTICYPFGEQKGHVANAVIVEKLRSELVCAGAVESMIIIPEYHKTRSAVHNHGIIRVAQNYTGDIESELRRLWVDRYSGSLHFTSLDANKLFEDYLTKFVKADKSRLYNFCDGLVVEGIDFNAVSELKVSQPALLPIKSFLKTDIDEVQPVVNQYECIASMGNNIELDTPSVKILGLNHCFQTENPTEISKENNEAIPSIKALQKLLPRLYYWYSVMVIMYLNYIMRV